MDDLNLFLVCANAFIAVLVLLSVLALLMRLLITLFPAKPDPKHITGRAGGVSAPLTAAIQSAVHAIYPGARVTRIDELKR